MANQLPAAAGAKKVSFTNRELISLIAPLIAEQFFAITVGLADSLMVATVGDAAISAVSLVDSISNLMIYIFSAMAAGVGKSRNTWGVTRLTRWSVHWAERMVATRVS